MAMAVIKVDGMSCDHCVKAVKESVGALPGVSCVSVELSAGSVTVEYEPAHATIEGINAEIEAQGFAVVS